MTIYYKYLLYSTLLFLPNMVFAQTMLKGNTTLKVKENSHFVVKGNLIIKENSKVEINGFTTVDGNLTSTNKQQIRILEEGDLKGSLIAFDGNPTGTIQKHYKTNSRSLSSFPVNGESLYSFTQNIDPVSKVSFFSQENGNFINIDDVNTNLISGKGYLLEIDPHSGSHITSTISGQLNTGDYFWNNSGQPPLAYSNSGSGFNLIANPFTSAVDLDYYSISKSGLENSYWVYDNDLKRVSFRNSGGYGNMESALLKTGQAFFVKANNSNALLNIPHEAKVHDDGNFYGMPPAFIDNSQIVLEVTDPNGNGDEVWVGYQFDSDDNFNDGVDISKLKLFADLPQLYTSHNNLELSVDMITKPHGSTSEIPIYLDIAQSGTHELFFKSFYGFMDMQVLLTDLVTYDQIDPTQLSSYSFNAKVGDNPNRFLLQFIPPVALGNEIINNSADINIYGNTDEIVISCLKPYLENSKEILIYNTKGQLIIHKHNQNGKIIKIPHNIKNQVIIVKTIINQNIYTKKVSIN